MVVEDIPQCGTCGGSRVGHRDNRNAVYKDVLYGRGRTPVCRYVVVDTWEGGRHSIFDKLQTPAVIAVPVSRGAIGRD